MKLIKPIYFSICFLLMLNYTGFSQGDNNLVGICVKEASNDATYLKDYVVKLPSAHPGSRQPVAKNTILLHKDTQYRFTICSSKKYNGEGILQLYDTKRMLASTYNPKTGKTYNSIDFYCTKSGQYTIYISFKDGEEGMAVGILSYVKK